MLSLIVTILFGLGVAYFALQNSLNVAIHFGNYTINAVPIYTVVILSILAGVLISGIISGLNSLSAFLALRGKDKVIKDHKRSITNLKQEVRQLEVENAKLKEKHDAKGEVITERDTASEPEYKPQFNNPSFLHPAHNH